MKYLDIWANSYLTQTFDSEKSNRNNVQAIGKLKLESLYVQAIGILEIRNL